MIKKFALESKITILFVSNKHYPKHYEKHIRKISTLLATYQNKYQLLFKIHPHDESVSFIQKIFSEQGLEQYKIFEFESLYEIALTADIVITNYSTAILELHLLNKKIIQIDYENKLKSNYASNGELYYASTNEDIKKYLDLILAGKDSLKPSSFSNHYKQEPRYKILELIRSLIEK